MPPIQRTPFELEQIESNSYLAPEVKESTFGEDITHLGITVNSWAAAVAKGNSIKDAEDAAEASDVVRPPFTREGWVKTVTEGNFSPNFKEKLLTSTVRSHVEADARIAYIKRLDDADKSLTENMSGTGRFVSSLLFAAFDPTDVATVLPFLKIGKAFKPTTFGGKVAKGAVIGSAIGTSVTAGYNFATDIDPENSLISGAVLGLGLGGVLGALGAKTSQSKTFSSKDGENLSKQEATAEEFASLTKENEGLTDLIKELESSIKNSSSMTKQEVESLAADRKVAANAAKQQQTVLQEKLDYAKKQHNEAKANVSSVDKVGETLRKEGNALERTILKAEGGIAKAKVAAVEYKKTAKLISTTKGQITKLTKQLNALKTKRTKEANLKRTNLKASIAKLEKKLEDTSKSRTKGLRVDLAKLGKTIEDLAPNTPTLVKALEKQLKGVRSTQSKATSNLLKNRKLQEDTKVARDAAQKERAAYKIPEQKVSLVRPSAETTKLQEKLAEHKVNMTPEGLLQLVEKRGLLGKELEDLSKNGLNLKKLREVRASQSKTLSNLSKELDSIGKLDDFRDSALFKRSPAWMRKLLISPIERNLNSATAAVRNFSSMLHSGTIHHGKINNMTAWVLRQMLDVSLDRMHKAMIYNYTQAVKNGYTGDKAKFDQDVFLNANSINGNIQRDVFTGIDGAIVGMDRFKIAQERIGSTTRSHSSSNEWVKKATDDYLDYFEAIHSHGSKLGMEAFNGSLSKGYSNRTYSAARIEAFGGRDAAVEHLTKAQESFARATNSEVSDLTMAEFRAKAERAVDSSLDHTQVQKKVTQDMGFTRASSTTSLKQRGIDVFDDEIADLLETNITATSLLYGRRVHGRLALKERFGVDNDVQLSEMVKQLGGKPNEIDNINVIVETILGRREISKNAYDPFTRVVKAVSSYSSVMHTMAFALPTVTEVASLAKEFGWGKAMNTFIGNPQEIYSTYRFGTPSEKNSVELMISYGDAHFANRANRMESENFDSVAGQHKLDDIVRWQSVYSGLMPLTDMLRMSAASLSVDFMATLSVANRVSKADMKRLNDMGFGAEDLENIRTTLQVDKTGRINNMDRKTWGALDRKITAGVMTMVERTILDPNGITLPKFMTNMNEGQLVPRVMMKFMRYPFESYERMLVRGIQESDAKQATAFAGNIAIWMFILSAKDAMKSPEDQRYTGDEGTTDLFTDAAMRNSWTSGLSVGLDTVAGLATGSNLTNDYEYKVGGAVQSDYESALKGEFRYALPFTSVKLGNDGIGEHAAKAIGSILNLETIYKDD